MKLKEMKTIVFGKKFPKRTRDTDSRDIVKKSRTKDSYKRPIPADEEVTETIIHDLPHDTNSRTRTKVFYTEDIPLAIPKIVEKHIITQVWNNGSWLSPITLPLQRVILGPNVRMLIATLSTQERLSDSQIKNTLSLLYHFDISMGEISKIRPLPSIS